MGGRIGYSHLNAALRSGLRFDIPAIIEPQEGGFTPAPVQAILNDKVYDVPRFEDGADQYVQFNMPINKLLAQLDTTSDVVCSLRVDLHYAVNVSDAATGDIQMNLDATYSGHNVGDEAGIGTSITQLTHLFSEDFNVMTTDSDYKSTRDIAHASYGLIIDRAELARDSYWAFRLWREGTNVADTYTGDLFLIGVELFFFYGDKP